MPPKRTIIKVKPAAPTALRPPKKQKAGTVAVPNEPSAHVGEDDDDIEEFTNDAVGLHFEILPASTSASGSTGFPQRAATPSPVRELPIIQGTPPAASTADQRQLDIEQQELRNREETARLATLANEISVERERIGATSKALEEERARSASASADGALVNPAILSAISTIVQEALAPPSRAGGRPSLGGLPSGDPAPFAVQTQQKPYKIESGGDTFIVPADMRGHVTRTPQMSRLVSYVTTLPLSGAQTGAIILGLTTQNGSPIHWEEPSLEAHSLYQLVGAGTFVRAAAFDPDTPAVFVSDTPEDELFLRFITKGYYTSLMAMDIFIDTKIAPWFPKEQVVADLSSAEDKKQTSSTFVMTNSKDEVHSRTIPLTYIQLFFNLPHS